MVSEIDKFREERNHFIHWQIEFKDENVEKGFITVCNLHKKIKKKYTIDDLENLSKKLENTVMGTLAFIKEAFPEERSLKAE